MALIVEYHVNADMYPIEDAGLIKIDLLSQRSLGVLRDTMNAINVSNNS